MISLNRFCDITNSYFPFEFFGIMRAQEMITVHALMAEMASINRMVNAAMTAIYNTQVQRIGCDSSSDGDDFLDRRRYSTVIQVCKYEGRAKRSVTNRLPWFYPRYILKCFTALEWCVKSLTIPIYFVQIAFQLPSYFKLK